MNNISKIIKGHNKKVISKPRDQRPKYNCRKKAECPMEGNCQVNDIVYKCDVTRGGSRTAATCKIITKRSILDVAAALDPPLVTRPLPKKVYLGLTEGEWKRQFHNQKLLFKHKRYTSKTILSSYMWHDNIWQLYICICNHQSTNGLMVKHALGHMIYNYTLLVPMYHCRSNIGN